MAITPGDVTQFLRDYPEFNILLDAVQFTEDDINKAMKFTVDRFNVITPISTFSSDNFPNDWLLLMGVVSHLMQSEACLQLRNQATYRDGDVENIGVDDKFALYVQMSDRLAAEFRDVSQKLKQQQNMEAGYDSLSSGYRYLRIGMRNII